ncbi:efflux RND transporter periplasmic adaptor subunit [Pedobacter alluvionis]|uniref:Cobalt-zinc-cadmium efflux system membrane fusion protein n=1 Tax=Pedobacter alluvionis TaxID=475253 RepID=A0A497YA97_9SPHI|nr:efflux RND transporter periplasmic adaptor subunit [Pedobacter alluvionis]RLJ79397.1 cobalt-zinc-cadmium efflux system membrane fusion protein [Pedobacter alluvionis]TFB30750.1 efflux RND transporter periplasmic adaptor subunit [Pedobacter alluvionis]
MRSLYKYFILLSFPFYLAGCSSPNAEKEPEKDAVHEERDIVTLTPEQHKLSEITLGDIELKELSGTTKVNGMLDLPPQSLVSISTPLEGIVKSTNMLQGKRVAKGELVAVMQNPEFIQMQQDYLDYKSQLQFLKQELDRQEELAKENVNSKKALQKARSEYQSVSARLLGQRSKLSIMNISFPALEKGQIQKTFNLYTPMAGYVTQVNTNIGAFANTTDVLFKIADTEHLHAELTVFEKDVPKLKLGQKVRFVLANEEKERMATVYLIGREISKERTVQIHCHLDKEDTQLLPGMYLKAYVESGMNKVEALPDAAIVEFEGKKIVFINQPAATDSSIYRYRMMEVKTGVAENGYTQVSFGGQINNAKVVIKGAYDLLSKVKNAEEEGH